LKNQNLCLFSPPKTKSLILFVFIFLNLYVGKVKNVKLRVNLSMFFFFEKNFSLPSLEKRKKEKDFLHTTKLALRLKIS